MTQGSLGGRAKLCLISRPKGKEIIVVGIQNALPSLRYHFEEPADISGPIRFTGHVREEKMGTLARLASCTVTVLQLH